MGDVPISGLPDAGALTGTESIPMVQSGETVKAFASALAGLVSPAGSDFATQYRSGSTFGGTGPGTVGQVLTSNGTDPPTYQTIGSNSNVDSLFPDVGLLLHLDGVNGGTVFTDSSSFGNIVTGSNGAALSTANPKFGTAAATFNGVNSQLSIPMPSKGPLDIWHGDCTVEGWMNPVSISGGQTIMDMSNGNSTGGILSMDNTGHLTFSGFGGSASGSNSVAVVANVWSHFAFVRYGTLLIVFLNGIPVASLSFVNTAVSGGNLIIGFSGGFGAYNGLLDEIRITKGVARYINQFTPPTTPFPNQ